MSTKDYTYTEEQRARLKASAHARWSDPEERRRQSERRKGKPFTEAHKQALRDAWARKRAAKEVQQ